VAAEGKGKDKGMLTEASSCLCVDITRLLRRGCGFGDKIMLSGWWSRMGEALRYSVLRSETWEPSGGSVTPAEQGKNAAFDPEKRPCIASLEDFMQSDT